MERQRFKKRKKPNYKKGLFLITLLLIILYLWTNLEKFITTLFE